MKLSIIIAVIFVLGVVSGEKSSVARKRFDSGYHLEGGLVESAVHIDGLAASGKGFSIGSGLRSIAHESADQAHSAVSSQHAAARQASYVAKSTLAQAAVQAANTAQAALTGKEVLVQGLERQSIDARHALEAEIAQLQTAKRTATATANVAQQASHHIAVLTSAINSAQSVAELADIAAHEAANELASQTGMIGKAKAHLQAIEEQLHSAHIDYEATKDATAKASASAIEAQNNAAVAGHHATIELHEVARPAPVVHHGYASQSIIVDNGHHYSH